MHRKFGPVSRILWEWRGHAIVRPRARFITSLVTRPAVSTAKHCAIYFTMTSARGSCTNRVLLSFVKSVRSCKLSWSSRHHPHLQAAHQPHPPMPTVQTHQMSMSITSHSPNSAPLGPRRTSTATPRRRDPKGTIIEWESGYISAIFLR